MLMFPLFGTLELTALEHAVTRTVGSILHSSTYRDRLEALPGLFRRSRRKPKCDRTATGRHLLPLDI